MGDPATSQHDLDLLVGSSELLMKALQSAGRENDRLRLRKKCEGLLRRAEAAKAILRGSSSSAGGQDATRVQPAAKAKTTVSNPIDQLSTKEKVILLRSSKVNGFTFPPWQSTPDLVEFALGSGEEKYR